MDFWYTFLCVMYIGKSTLITKQTEATLIKLWKCMSVEFRAFNTVLICGLNIALSLVKSLRTQNMHESMLSFIIIIIFIFTLSFFSSPINYLNFCLLIAICLWTEFVSWSKFSKRTLNISCSMWNSGFLKNVFLHCLRRFAFFLSFFPPYFINVISYLIISLVIGRGQPPLLDQILQHTHSGINTLNLRPPKYHSRRWMGSILEFYRLLWNNYHPITTDLRFLSMLALSPSCSSPTRQQS